MLFHVTTAYAKKYPKSKLIQMSMAVLIKRIEIDDILNEREKNKLLQEEMEATLHDIQNM